MIDLVAVNAGLGEPSSTRMLVDRLVAATSAALGGNRVDATTIDVRDSAVDLGRSMAAGFALGEARTAIAAVEKADALIVASPVFNASYSGLFKTLFDLVDVDAMAGTPVLIAATGGSPRHSMVLDFALRPLFSYLRTVVMPTGVYAANQDWSGSAGEVGLSERIDRAARELAASLEVGHTLRATTAAPSESVESAPESAGIATFARLLGNAG